MVTGQGQTPGQAAQPYQGQQQRTCAAQAGQKRRPAVSFYDLAIVGSGSAAFAAAIRARERGARVVMVERGTPGGTCVNVGCVPSKFLLQATQHYHRAGHPLFPGLLSQVGPARLGELVRAKGQLVERLRQVKYLDLAREYGWEIVTGQARFEEGPVLRADGRRIEAAAYLVATGSSPAIPPIPGLKEAGYLTSTEAMELESPP
ncbi:MAG TPA: FAD-dependent oxidoreductase, partial [Candidatus Nitrosotenuis sp.]|nr:FAD-dependent oxidoreductase [Candidatus Nitrosotenuis sp.]